MCHIFFEFLYFNDVWEMKWIHLDLSPFGMYFIIPCITSLSAQLKPIVILCEKVMENYCCYFSDGTIIQSSNFLHIFENYFLHKAAIGFRPFWKWTFHIQFIEYSYYFLLFKCFSWNINAYYDVCLWTFPSTERFCKAVFWSDTPHRTECRRWISRNTKGWLL